MYFTYVYGHENNNPWSMENLTKILQESNIYYINIDVLFLIHYDTDFLSRVISTLSIQF